MPQQLEHIDAIARREGRDVLYLTFYEDQTGARVSGRWQDNPSRQAVIDWLMANGYAWSACGEIAKDNAMASYRGSIYIATPFDRELPAYRKLQNFLEHDDGSLRLPKMRFWALALSVATKNAHHDEPGYWERWAENL